MGGRSCTHTRGREVKPAYVCTPTRSFKRSWINVFTIFDSPK